MRKYFCDACGIEIKQNSLNHFTYHCHIADRNMIGYVDSEGNAVSGREESKEVCNKCYNTILSTAYAKYEEIRNKNNE